MANKENHPYHDDSMWKGAPGEGFSKARRLRKRMTRAEKLLWEKLRNKKVKGFKFRRQHPIAIYIVDFYCHELKLVIEVDGKYHNKIEQRLKDKERTQFIQFQGLQVIRFTNEEIINDLNTVLQKIENEIEKLRKSPFRGT